MQVRFFAWRRVGFSVAYAVNQETVAEALYQNGAMSTAHYEPSVGGTFHTACAGIEFRASPGVSFSLLYGAILSGHRTQYTIQDGERAKYAEYEYVSRCRASGPNETRG